MFITEQEYESMSESQKLVIKRLKHTIEDLIKCGDSMSTYRDGTTNYENAKYKFELISRKFNLDVVE